MTETTKRYHHGDLRRALIDTAFTMLAEDQGWQFTLRELARRAGVTHAAPYKHFDDKAALLAELAVQGFDRLHDAILAACPDDAPSRRETFMAMCLAYVAFGTSNANLYRLMWSTDARAAQNGDVAARANTAFDVLFDRVRRGQEAGWLAPRDAAGQAIACWTQLHGLTLLAADGLLSPRGFAADPVETALRELLTGLER